MALNPEARTLGPPICQDILYGGLEHTGVDCVFWNGSPGATALYPSTVLEMMGESQGCYNSGVPGVRRGRLGPVSR